MTYASSGLPPTSCSTLGCLDFSLVPLPAAMMAMAMRGADIWLELLFLGFDIGTNIPRESGARQVHFSFARPLFDGGMGALPEPTVAGRDARLSIGEFQCVFLAEIGRATCRE